MGTRAPLQNPAATRLQWLAMALLGLALVGLRLQELLAGLVTGLGVLTALKLLEAKRLEERRLVGLLQLLLAGLLACLRPELGPSLLQGLAILISLAGLLALEQGDGPGLRVLLRRSLLLVLVALPMALVLFALAPRLDPFTTLPEGHGAGAATGLSREVDPGSIASLAVSRAPAARVVFPGGSPPVAQDRYWRVLVHDRFDGRRWSAPPPPAGLSPTSTGARGPTGPAGDNLLQIWIHEASGLAALPWGGVGQPATPGVQLSDEGELRARGSTLRRRLYGIAAGPSSWRNRPPDPADRVLPKGVNPRLEALGRSWAGLGPAPVRLAAAERWFREQPFRYSLSPGTLPQAAPLDSFLFEQRIGFCGHYASAHAALMRAAGLPARVVSGYRGGEWVQPLGGPGYLELLQSDAHAWSEVWLEGEGWRRVDPTGWISSGGATAAGAERQRTGVGPLLWLQRQWWGLDLAWSRLWLGFDRDSQEALLRRLLGGRLEWAGWLLTLALGLCLAVALAVVLALERRGGTDPWRRELDRLMRAARRQGMQPGAGETLEHFCARLIEVWPELAAPLARFRNRYLQQRFGAGPQPSGALQQLRCERRQLTRHLQRHPRPCAARDERVQRVGCPLDSDEETARTHRATP